MGKTKTVWRSISIPEALFLTVRKLIVYTGDPSIGEYVRFAVRERINRDEAKLSEEQFDKLNAPWRPGDE